VLRKLGELLASARARVAVPLVAALLTSTSLANGVLFDDALQRAKARGLFGADLATRLDLFTFMPGTPAGNAFLFDRGFAPWFASRALRLAFLRPIAALSELFDYTVLDRWPWAMHLESVAAYALVVAVVAAAYRRLLPSPIAALAALLYACDDAHAFPACWLANRNALFATGFVVAAWIAHDRWRRDRWRAGAWVGPLAFGAALASGEIALCGVAYLVAHAATLDPAPTRRARAAAIAPYLLIVVAWQATYRALGYGARASALYIDPATSPWEFARAAPIHALSLLYAQIGTPPADVWLVAPGPVRLVLAAIALGGLGLVARVLAPRWRRDPVLRFFVGGALLAVVPVLATVPSNRLLALVGFGAFGVAASVLGDLRAPPENAPRAERVLRGAWIALLLVVSPLLLAIGCGLPSVLRVVLDRVTGAANLGPEVASETVVLANVPNIFLVYPIFLPSADEHPSPWRLRILLNSTGRVAVTREDARTLLTERDDAPPDPLSALFRPTDDPIRAGDSYDVAGMRADVLRVDARGSPTAVRFRFDDDVSAPSFRWLTWNGSAIVPTAAPAIGARVTFGPP
jgi:hypothetical protein